MRILLLYNTMDYPETQLILRAHGEGLELEVMANPQSGNYRLLEGSAIPAEPLICRSRVDLRAVSQIRRKLCSARFDLVHAFTSRALSAAILATTGMREPPQIVAYRGAMGNVSRWDPTSWLTYRNPKVRSINCVSDAVLRYLADCGIPQDKLQRIYKGHDVDWYSNVPAPNLREFGIPSEAFVVCCVANMRPNKGVDVLLEAATLLQQYEDMHFLLVGDIRDSRISALADTSPVRDRLHFTGVRDDAPGIVRSSDVFVMPTRFTEGFPKAVIEAMCQEVPPVVTRVGGMVELVRDHQDGLVVEPNNARSLADGILELYQDRALRNHCGRSARQRILQDFNVAETVEQTRQWYKEVAQS